jgi:hypothetical protein
MLSEDAKLLEMKIVAQLAGDYANVEEKRKAFEMLNYLKKNIAEKYEKLKNREVELISMDFFFDFFFEVVPFVQFFFFYLRNERRSKT